MYKRFTTGQEDMVESQHSTGHPNREGTKNPYGSSKQQILKAAEVLFAKSGFANTTLRDVANASGANTALVGYYFGGKDGLRRAVADQQIERLQGHLERIVNSSTIESKAEFLQMVSACLQFLREDDLVYHLRLWAMADESEFAQHMSCSIWRLFFDKLGSLIRRLNPEASQETVEARAMYLGSLFQQFADVRWMCLDALALSTPKERLLEIHAQYILDESARLIFGPSVIEA